MYATWNSKKICKEIQYLSSPTLSEARGNFSEKNRYNGSMSGKSPWTRTVIMYPSPNLQNIEISLNTSTSAVLETSNLLIPPLALTITPIFGERESLFSTRIPIKILLFCSETKWMRWSKRWVTSAHFKVALLSKKVDSVSTILLWYE